MCASARAWGCALGWFWFMVLECGQGTAQAQVAPPADLQRGRALFERIWEAGDPDLLGDGLGPMFNERSCIACHSQGGIGGAGLAEHNVDVLTAAPPTDVKKLAALIGRLRQLHPGFGSGTSTVLHRFSTSNGYPEFREKILGFALVGDELRQAVARRAVRKRQGSGPIKKIKSPQGDVLYLSQRNTTPLFGAGLIDGISAAEIGAAAVEQNQENANVTGRFVGRFGWRGQVADLKSFVMGACAVELGLNVPGNAQSVDPLRPAGQPAPLDLNQAQCDDLIEFVASLPAPRRLQVERRQLSALGTGESLFESIGCAVCHRPTLGHVSGIYSDLLVHDLGARLEDPASASNSASVQYYGPPPDLVSPLAQERRREWKTPPLWGVRDSGPYMHDGRAATLEESILWHGGEAASSLDRYQTLPAAQRNRLLLFLSTLAAPDRGLLAQHAAANR